jgi:hypothetical protein
MSDDGFWCPHSIAEYDNFLRSGIEEHHSLNNRGDFVRNIGYSLQYLEFLDHTLNNDHLHATVLTLTQKTFVITGMSIVEAILWYVVRRNGHQKKKTWETVHESEGNPYLHNGQSLRVRASIERKLDPPVNDEMTLDSLAKKAESRHLIGGVGNPVYAALNRLRQLRNRVHVHLVDADTITDWHNFSDDEVELMKVALLAILSSALFPESEQRTELTSFLQPNDAE